MNEAAESLGISRRTLSDWLKRAPYYELRGRKKVFYPEHIMSLRKEISSAGLVKLFCPKANVTARINEKVRAHLFQLFNLKTAFFIRC